METINDKVVGNTEKHLFSRMLDIGVDPEMAKKIMSFWMFLESKDFKNILELINSKEDSFLRCLCVEAEMALAFLESQSDPARRTSSISCPITCTLRAPSFLSGILGDKRQVSNDILALQDKVINIAFQQILDERGIKDNLEYLDVKEDSDQGIPSENSEIHASKSPFVAGWKPKSKDERSLFMTFSRGYPLSNSQIVDYFRREYGDCVEDCFVFKKRDRRPEFGIIAFKFSWMLDLILNNRESVMIDVGGKTICLKKYKPS